MSLHRRTAELRDAGRKTLVPYLTAGYPDRPTFRRLLAATARAGCSIVEVGVPFSDPVADGPVIQASGAAALRVGAHIDHAIEDSASHASATGSEVILMSYINPILRMGWETFTARAAASGLAGVILPDVPFEESAPARRSLGDRGLELLDLVAPTSGAEREETIAASARGFLYLVSLTGVTGSALDVDGALRDFVLRVKARTGTPCYVGFGVAEPAQAAALGSIADGVIVGSALLRRIAAAGGADAAVAEAERYLDQMNAALAGDNGKDQR